MKTLVFLKRELVQILLLALPFAFAAACWNKMPPVVATHWGIDGQPDGWMPKAPGVLLVPVLNVGLCALIVFLPGIDPRLRRNPDANNARQRRLRRTLRYALSAFLSLLSMMIIAIAAGWPVNVGNVCYYSLLTLFAVIGNFFGNLEPNYLVGIRTPWTLEDPGTWRATHRLIGRWMTFGAVALLAVGIFAPPFTRMVLLVAYPLAMAIWSLGYSAWFFHRRRAV